MTALTPNGSAVSGQSTSIQLTISDPCEPPSTVTPSSVSNQSYTLAASALDITWNAWSTSPDCSLSYIA